MTGRLGAIGKVLRIVGLGIAIWSLSLVWPELNLALSWPLAAGVAALWLSLMAGVGAALVLYLKNRSLMTSPQVVCYPGSGQKPGRANHASRPVHITPA